LSSTRPANHQRIQPVGDSAGHYPNRVFERHKISRLFPGCPSGRATAIARHTGLRGSGRVGRSAAGRALDDNAITLAVIASICHHDTSYDTLLMAGQPRDAAREQVRPDINRILDAWRQPSRQP
jgi:hypothetical protein